MSDDIAEPPPAQPEPPAVEVARPDTPAPRVDSLGRSMEKKRGRKPGPQGPRNVNTAAALKTELGRRLPKDAASLTDEMVGVAISGALAAIGLVAGPHWRALPSETRDLGEAFGPLARVYGSEELAKWITVLLVIPTVVTIVAPRIAIQSMIAKKEMPKEEGRSALLRIKAMMAAEEDLNIDHQAQEAKAYVQEQVNVGLRVAAQVKAQQITDEGVVTVEQVQQ